MKYKLALSSVLLSSLISLSGCGGGGGSTDDNENTTPTTNTTNLLGSAFKGAIDNALIRVLDANNNVLASGSSAAG